VSYVFGASGNCNPRTAWRDDQTIFAPRGRPAQRGIGRLRFHAVNLPATGNIQRQTGQHAVADRARQLPRKRASIRAELPVKVFLQLESGAAATQGRSRPCGASEGGAKGQYVCLITGGQGVNPLKPAGIPAFQTKVWVNTQSECFAAR